MIILTVLASYRWLGFLTGDDTAHVAKAASLFYANFHFIATGTNYLASQAPPSALQNFWSLSVEEQFYLVYPTIFIVTALAWRKRSLRAKLIVVLVCVIGCSFAWSVHQTTADSVSAFFSPLTRAWELALGALVAVSSVYASRIPDLVSRVMTWIGLAAVLFAAVWYSSTTPYPGAYAAVPVLGTALVICGGVAQPRFGAEIVLRQAPFQWAGKLSYSLYLWHWPILIIVAQHVGKTLSVKDNLLLIGVAIGLSVGSYFLIENPIRHWSVLRRSNARSLLLGACLIGVSIGLASLEIAHHP